MKRRHILAALLSLFGLGKITQAGVQRKDEKGWVEVRLELKGDECFDPKTMDRICQEVRNMMREGKSGTAVIERWRKGSLHKSIMVEQGTSE